MCNLRIVNVVNVNKAYETKIYLNHSYKSKNLAIYVSCVKAMFIVPNNRR